MRELLLTPTPLFRKLRQLTLLLSLLLVPQLAGAVDYPLTIAGVQVTDANAGGITGTNISGKVTYDESTHTIKLEGATINGQIEWTSTSYPTIELKGLNQLTYSGTATNAAAFLCQYTCSLTVAKAADASSATLKVVKFYALGNDQANEVLSSINKVSSTINNENVFYYTTEAVYKLSVAAIQVHDIEGEPGYKGNILQDEGTPTATFDGTNKITLNGATLTNFIHWMGNDNLTIELNGTNSITRDGFCIDYEGTAAVAPEIAFTAGGENCSLVLNATSYAVIEGFNYTNAPSMGTGLYWIPTSNNGTITSATITNSILGGGAGTEGSPFIISTFEHLKTFAKYVNDGILSTEYIKLGESIECTNQTGFEPIGNTPKSFIGTFDGGGNSISGLSFSNTNPDGVSGLFGNIGSFNSTTSVITRGTVKNLTLNGCQFGNGAQNGAIAGFLDYGTIEKCTVISCTISSGNSTSTFSGGITGMINNGVVKDCVVNGGEITSSTDQNGGDVYAGGIVASAYSSSEINGCTVTDVSINSTGNDQNSYSGGIVGESAATISGNSVEGTTTVNSINNNNDNVFVGAIVANKTDGSLTNNYYYYTVNTKTKIGDNEPVEKSGYTQRGIGGNSSGGSNYDEIGKVELATKKVKINVVDGFGTGPYSVENTYYYILKDDFYYVSPNKEFKYSATPSSAYYKPRQTLDDGTIEVTPVEIYNSGVYNHTEFTFTMPNADVTATLSFPINLAADGITATIDDLDYTGSAIEPTTIKIAGIPGPTGVTELTKGTDFTITGYKQGSESVTSPTSAGTYTAIIEGAGDYIGTMEVNFNITIAYNLWVAGTQVKSNNKDNILAGGTNDNKVSFTPAATASDPNTLTLNNASINGTIVNELSNLTIVFEGDNELTGTSGYISSTDNTAPLTLKGGTGTSLLTLNNSVGQTAISGFASVTFDGAYLTASRAARYVTGTDAGIKDIEGGIVQLVTITTEEHYPLWVNSTQVKPGNQEHVLGDTDYTVIFDGANTLTLNGASFSNSNAIESNLDNLIVKLKGDNSVSTYTYGHSAICSGIETATLTIEKDASATGYVSLSMKTGGDPLPPVIRGFQSVSHDGLNFASKTGSKIDDAATKDAILTSATIYSLWVGGTLVTSNNTSGTDATTSNIIWSYDAANNKLTLNNYSKTDNDGHAFISNMANLNVYLVGTNTVGPSSQISTDKAFYTTYTNATLTFSTDESAMGTLDASGFNTFCEGFRDVNGIYCNNGLGYYPGTREIKAKATPTISFNKRQQTGDNTPGLETGIFVGSETLTTTYGSTFYAPKPTFNNGYLLNDTTRFEYSYSVDGVVEYPNNGEDANNPGKIRYGEISLLKAGTVTITCSFPGNMQNNPCSASYTLQVNKADAQVFEYEVEGQKITAANGYIDVDGTTSKWGTPQVSGEEPILSKPNDATSITYESSDNNVATVSTTGAVTPKGPGTATISATLKDDERYNDSTATYTLIVMAPATVSFANATASILNTETYTQAATTIPEGSSITYSTNNTNGNVSVNGNGEVTISNSFCGTVTITATVTSVPDANPQYYYVLSNNAAFQASYTLTVSKIFNDVTFADGQNYATYYNGSDDMTVPEGLTAYLVTGTSGNSVVTYQINYLPKNVPLLLEKSATAGSTLTNTTYSGTGLTDAEKNSNLLQHAEGNLPVANITGGTPYVLYKNEFVKATGTISADHCYMLITNNAPTRGFYSIGDGNDDSTAIEGIEFENEEVSDEWYDLQGRRIQKPTKAGLYIVNGKKVVINNK